MEILLEVLTSVGENHKTTDTIRVLFSLSFFSSPLKV